MPSPKLLLVGGSNLAFGMNTEAVANALEMPTYNMGVHAGLGLSFMLKSLEPHINKGDIVVVVPEYSQYGTGLYGADELLTALTDIIPEQKKYLSYYQMWQLSTKLPKIVGRKVFHATLKTLAPNKYKEDKHLSPLYHKNTFNQYGDATKHWNAPPIAIAAAKVEGTLDPAAFDCLNAFITNIEAKGGTVLVSYPCYQASSFDKSLKYIHSLDSTLQKNNIQLLNTPQRYKMKDEHCFDTYYHLTKEGLNLRTQLLIEDLKKIKN